MPEFISLFERRGERILTEREILQVLLELAGEQYEIYRREEDQAGIRRLDIITRDEQGEVTKFDYTRSDNNGDAVIDVVYFQGELPVGGRTLKTFRHGVWVDEE